MKKIIGSAILLSAVLFVSAAQADTCKRPQDHQYGEWQTAVEAGCTKSGRREAVCQICGYTKDEMLAVTGHEWGEMAVTKKPTCTRTGVGEKTCLRCGRTQQVKLGKIEHSWGEWSVRSAPEGKYKGLRVSTCTVCSAKHEEGFYQEGTLYEGVEPSDAVVYLQMMLSDLGFYKGAIGSGQYGELTTTAVTSFQQHILLEVTGVADWQTQAALRIAWEKTTGKAYGDMVLPKAQEAAE